MDGKFFKFDLFTVKPTLIYELLGNLLGPIVNWLTCLKMKFLSAQRYYLSKCEAILFVVSRKLRKFFCNEK